MKLKVQEGKANTNITAASKIMLMIQQKPKLSYVKPEILEKRNEN